MKKQTNKQTTALSTHLANLSLAHFVVSVVGLHFSACCFENQKWAK
jgi:hypothetical protein